MTPTAQTSKIADLRFETGFTGDAKIFVKVEKASNGSENLVIYEKSGIAAFFTDIFRDRRSTLTLREWAGNAQDCLPQTLNKERLTQNIKQIKQAMEAKLGPTYALGATYEEAPLAVKVINQLVAAQNLDSDQKNCSDIIKDALPPLMFQDMYRQLKPSLNAILESLGLNEYAVGVVMNGNGHIVDAKKIEAAKSMLKAHNDANLENAFDELIQQTSDRRSLQMKVMYLAYFVQPSGNLDSLMGWSPSDAKSLAKFLLALDNNPAADDVQLSLDDNDVLHQRYINTLKLAIKKLEKIEQENAAATPQT